jgi:hypothetical protein
MSPELSHRFCRSAPADVTTEQTGGVSEVLPVDPVQRLARRLDPYMQRILDGRDDLIDAVAELLGILTEPPYFEHLVGVGWLYRVWGNLSDILDRYPVDYGPDTEAIAAQAFKRAAQDWLDMPRTRAGLEHYIERWRRRLTSL